MFNPIARYTHWLHTRWPSGEVERLPEVGPDGETGLPNVRIVGDLTGIPLLKFSADSGARAVQAIEKEGGDLVIVGGGVSGISAALEAKKAGLKFQVFEAAEPFTTIANFPKAKPIYTYPKEMTPAGQMQFHADVKEALYEELEKQRKDAGIEVTRARISHVESQADGVLVHIDGGDDVRAKHAIIAIGRSGDFRRLEVPGEDSDKVFNRLHDPKDYAGKNVLVVGGGDSALETAIALAGADAKVTLSYRKKEFNRPKSENVEKLRALPVEQLLETEVAKIEPDNVTLKDGKTLPNDFVFTMIGRDAPLPFLRRCGLRIRNEWTVPRAFACAAFVVFCFFLYHWSGGHGQELSFGGKSLQDIASAKHWFPLNLGETLKNPPEGNLLYTLKASLSATDFWYSLVYCALVVIFGIKRMSKRPTPYVRRQTLTLMAIQLVPIFILPAIILPWMGHNGWFEQGHPLRWIADQLFESYDGARGHERAYWRAAGFILAWPLFIYNVFTDQPMWAWLVISLFQTFVIIPFIVWRWGKGAYCGWICTCGALAETLGDAHRRKMPHGIWWNRLNMLGQVILAFAFALLGLRIAGWMMGPKSAPAVWFDKGYQAIPYLNYDWSVNVILSGVFGVGLYFWFSGRMWCRFACPLAALMNIYGRFSRFRIFADKKKCISCNVCTSVCHQGIDIMSFANKGEPMADPQCVRCSACVQECPTNVLTFGRYGANKEIILDRLPAAVPK